MDNLLVEGGQFVGRGYCSQGLFMLNVLKIMNGNASTSAYMIDSCDRWHGRLGHVGFSYIKKMKAIGLLHNVTISDYDKCEICVESKSTKKSCKSVWESELLELIHSDLGDLKNNLTRGGKSFYITFIDDYSRYTIIYLLKSKDEGFEIFLKYKSEVKNQLNKKIKRLRSDRGSEYELKQFKKFCEYDIIHETAPPYSLEYNGVAERKNRTLKNDECYAY